MIPILLISLLFGIVFCGEEARSIPKQERCILPLDRGDDCAQNGTIRWYMDQSRQECFPFKYKGCGGNVNNHIDQEQCFKCIKTFKICPGNTPPMTRTDGNSFCDTTFLCPQGAYCTSKKARIQGICCSQQTEKQQKEDQKAVCPSGMLAQRHSYLRIFHNVTLLGKSCEDEFCKPGSTCTKGTFYSWCCAKI